VQFDESDFFVEELLFEEFGVKKEQKRKKITRPKRAEKSSLFF
jgi:hypothetical protein